MNALILTALLLGQVPQAPRPPQAPPVANSGCQCGCAVTGQCDCKNCNLPKLKPGEKLLTDCKCGCVTTGKCKCKDCNHPQLWLDYTAGAAQAAATGKPLVTFLGCHPRAVAGAVVVWSDPKANIAGYDKAGIVISVPDGKGWLTWRATLPATATDAEIRAALAPRVGGVPWLPGDDPRDPRNKRSGMAAPQFFRQAAVSC